MTETPQITVGILTATREASLRRAIESVRAQTYAAWTCQVADNGNRSAVCALVASYADPRLRYLGHAENLGFAGNANSVLAAAETPFCALLHDDDAYHATYLEAMLAGLAAHPEARWAFSNALVVDDAGTTRCRWYPRDTDTLYPAGGALLARLAQGNIICCPTVVVHRDIYTTARFRTDLTYVEDLELWLRLARHYPALRVGTPLLSYTEGADSGGKAIERTLCNFHDEIALLAEVRGWPELRGEAAAIARQLAKRLSRFSRAILALPDVEDPAPHLAVLARLDAARAARIGVITRVPVLRRLARAWLARYTDRRAARRAAAPREYVIGELPD